MDEKERTCEIFQGIMEGTSRVEGTSVLSYLKDHYESCLYCQERVAYFPPGSRVQQRMIRVVNTQIKGEREV